MSWLGGLFGSGIAGTAKAVGSVAKDLADVFTLTDKEKLDQYRAETERRKVDQANELVQAQTNLAQVKHPSLFVAGARPAIMWICAIAMAYHFLVFPLVQPFVLKYTTIKLIDLNWQELAIVLGNLLGFSGMRSWEKYKGVARERVKQ